MTAPDPLARLWSVAELEPLAIAWMRERFPKAQIAREFVCGAGGSARIDLAAFLEDEIVGVELKADTDGPERLPLQAYGFSAVVSRVWLFCGPRVAMRCASHTPSGWGTISLQRLSAGAVSCREQYQPTASRYLCPAMLLDCLWREEIGKLAESLGLSPPKRCPHRDVADIILHAVPLPRIRAMVCETLRRRRWTKFGLDAPRVLLPDEIGAAS